MCRLHCGKFVKKNLIYHSHKMDHNLGDDLNLDTSMGVDFGHPEDVVVSQADIPLEVSGHEAGIPMDFEHIEEQPMLMDTGSEEIIDFMGEQFTLQEYAEHEDQSNILTTSITTNEHSILTTQPDNMIEIEPLPHRTTTKHDHTLPKMVTLKSEISSRVKKTETEVNTTAPRQVAIAPKPGPITVAGKFAPGKQFAIAPKPLTVLTGKNSFLKKVTLAGVMQGNTKGNTVLTQIGKQLVMMPATGTHKLKLLTSGTSVPTVQYVRTGTGDQPQLIQAKNVSAHNKPVITKLILPGQPNLEVSSNTQSLLTKVAPVSNAKSPTHLVAVQQKTVPLTLGNKVLLATPTKSGVKFAKKQQIIAFKSPEKISQAQGTATKKVLITPNPSQNVILKTTAPPKAQVMKDGNIVLDNQRTQLHQINVPGKGIQYIRLITNSNPAPAKAKIQPQTINMPAKTFLLTDSKGNLIQMSADKMMNSSHAPPLIVTSTASALGKVVNTKPQRKLVRIAPLVDKRVTTSADKPAQLAATSRSSQSLLAPISPIPEVTQSSEDFEVREEMDSKAALHALVLRDEGSDHDTQVSVKTEMQASMQNNMQNTMQTDMEVNMHADLHTEMQVDANDPNITEIEVEFKRDSYSDSDEVNDKSDHHELSAPEEHPLIVIPSNFKEVDNSNVNDAQSGHEDSQQMNSMLSLDAESMNAYQSPLTPQALSESEYMSTELGLRLRKACNCTKSQCLKLYCECFANGEFCNRCNCNNCHNNLENEERRQKAIRGCLDRNPNAFRPKIGKAKVGGPEMIRRHNKGCNCKRSGCLKNYCECYEAKIACTSICKCVGCRNVEETLERTRRRTPAMNSAVQALFRPPPIMPLKQPCSFITSEVVEAVCQCLLAAGGEGGGGGGGGDADAVRDVIDEFARCLQDIISAAQHTSPLIMLDEDPA